MSKVLPLLSAKSIYGGLEIPTLEKTSLDSNKYLLQLAAVVKNNLANILGLPAFELSLVESWLEEVIKFGLFDYDSEKDPKNCQKDKLSIETQEAIKNSLQVLNGKYSLACIELTTYWYSSEFQINANTQADKNSMANITEIPPENTRTIT